MPVLLRFLIQRLIVVAIAFLSFLGISPNLTIPTTEESIVATEERKGIIEEILKERKNETTNSIITPTEPIAVIDSTLLPEIKNTQKEEPTKVEINPVTTEGKNVPIIPSTNITINAKDTLETEISEQESTSESTINNIVLNIICTNREGNKIKVSTASGVLISPNGVVLTNAHVAQLFLLKNYPRENYMECSLRRENIPTYGYKADILYISKDWIRDNASLINDPAPRGTGENDYALLFITENTNPVLSLPTKFPYAELATIDGSVEVGDNITASGYPGRQISLLNLSSSARLIIDRILVNNIYTFAQTTTDVFSTSATSVAEKGSSGGGIFEDNKLVGIISTTMNVGGGNYINAITLSYINRDIKNETGYSLSAMISGDVNSRANNFNENEVPVLLKLLEKYL